MLTQGAHHPWGLLVARYSDRRWKEGVWEKGEKQMLIF